MANTGGPLDYLCSKHGLNAVGDTIPIMKVIGHHQPSNEQEVLQLIDSHNGRFCRECKCKGHGTLKDWANRMYEMQKEDEKWRKKNKLAEEYPFTRHECEEWFSELFLVAPLVGLKYEKMCFGELKNWLQENYVIREASRQVDTRYGVDIEVGRMEGSSGNRYRMVFRSLFGIQVKSKVYKNARKGVKEGLTKKQQSYSARVFFMYYDKDKDCLHDLKKLHKDLEYFYPYALKPYDKITSS